MFTDVLTLKMLALGVKVINTLNLYYVNDIIAIIIGLCTEGSVRITGTNSDRYGTVEVCTNGTWGTICNDFWDDIDAKVTCRQLGHSQYGISFA